MKVTSTYARILGPFDSMKHLGGASRRSRRGKRPFRKRTCRSKSRCGGAANNGQVAFGGSRGVRRSRRSRRGGAKQLGWYIQL